MRQKLVSNEQLKGENTYIDYQKLESDYQTLIQFIKNQLEVECMDQTLQFLQYSLRRAQHDLEKIEKVENADDHQKKDFDPNYFA